MPEHCRDDTVPVLVKIPADLSCTGEEKWKECPIDACIARLVWALQQAGVDMRSSCCGHGGSEGEITLQDGRMLLILDPETAAKYTKWGRKDRNVSGMIAHADIPY